MNKKILLSCLIMFNIVYSYSNESNPLSFNNANQSLTLNNENKIGEVLTYAMASGITLGSGLFCGLPCAFTACFIEHLFFIKHRNAVAITCGILGATCGIFTSSSAIYKAFGPKYSILNIF